MKIKKKVYFSFLLNGIGEWSELLTGCSIKIKILKAAAAGYEFLTPPTQLHSTQFHSIIAVDQRKTRINEAKRWNEWGELGWKPITVYSVIKR